MGVALPLRAGGFRKKSRSDELTKDAMVEADRRDKELCVFTRASTRDCASSLLVAAALRACAQRAPARGARSVCALPHGQRPPQCAFVVAAREGERVKGEPGFFLCNFFFGLRALTMSLSRPGCAAADRGGA